MIQYKGLSLQFWVEAINCANYIVNRNCENYIVNRNCGHQIIKLRSENGGEYVNNKFTNLCTEQGIQKQHTVLYTPQQNGVVERKNHSLK